METRAAVCEYDAKRDHMTLTIGSQGSHRLRDILCQNILKIPVEKMRVICPDVGGGFGTKLFPYREYALVAVAARKLRKTVKWAADRTDHFVGDAQGRDNVTTARMALAEDGKFLAMDADLMGDMGAYLSTFGPYIPHGGAGMLPAPVRHPGLPLSGSAPCSPTRCRSTPARGGGRPGGGLCGRGCPGRRGSTRNSE